MGIQRETKTNDQGVFVLTNLAPGEYEVRAAATGFKTRVHSATLEVGQSASLDVSLDVGTIADVSTTADIDLITRISSVVDGVINHRAIDHLPLNGRNFLELALLAPGNSPAPRRLKDTTYRAPGYPATPLFFFVVLMLVVILGDDPTQALLGVVVVGLGLLVYELVVGKLG